MQQLIASGVYVGMGFVYVNSRVPKKLFWLSVSCVRGNGLEKVLQVRLYLLVMRFSGSGCGKGQTQGLGCSQNVVVRLVLMYSFVETEFGNFLEQ